MDTTSPLAEKVVKKLLPSRPREGHKYMFGHVLVIGGSRSFPGAAALTSEAVLSAGAGAVTLAAPECVFEAGLMLPEIIHWPLAGEREGTLGLPDFREISSSDLEKFDVFAIGPGMGDTSATREFFDALLPYVTALKKPVVLDADALNCLSHNPVPLNDDIVITPHIGEGRRLLHANEHVDAVAMAQALRGKYNVQVVLKSAHTLIAGNDGKIWRNTTGDSGLATAGSGDVLTGIIAALLAQGCAPLAAAQLGVYLHGLAGQQASAEYTAYGVRAGLISEFLAGAFKSLMLD